MCSLKTYIRVCVCVCVCVCVSVLRAKIVAQTSQKEQEEQDTKAAGKPSANVTHKADKAKGGIGAALKRMWQAGGVWGLYQGLPTELVRGLLFQAILMATKEKLDTANARLVASMGRVRGRGSQ